MKLNPKKRYFRMEEGQFLGHVVSNQGIKANPTKIQALTSIKRTKTIKEVQSLNGKLACLNRFLSKSTEKSLPFFKTLEGCLEKKDFTWTREADKAFKEIKRYIEKLPTLVAPKAGENLIVYLAASKECIRRVVRWAIELLEHEIEFKPRNAVKAQILVNFLAETKKEDEETDFQEQQLEGQNTRWKLYTDGASSATNNKAGYEAVIAGLRIAKEMKKKEITVLVDSQLVASQVNGLY
ncbi:reverse transcriptase domain-containing protein [Tanacetum coccineum]